MVRASRQRTASTATPPQPPPADTSTSPLSHSTSTHAQHEPSPPSSPTTTAASQRVPAQPADYVHIGAQALLVGQRLLPLADSTDLYTSQSWAALFDQLDEQGVILVRGVIGKETAGRAREAVLDHIRRKGALSGQVGADAAGGGGDARALISTAQGGKLAAGWTIDACSGGDASDRANADSGGGGSRAEREKRAAEHAKGWRDLGTSATLTDVYNGNDLRSFLASLFEAAISKRRQQYPHYQPGGGSGPMTTFPECTWLRIRGHKDHTTEHTDYYYFKRDRRIFTEHWQPALTTHSPPPPNQPPSPSCPACNTVAASLPSLRCALCCRTYHRACLEPPPPAKCSSARYHCFECANLPFPFYTCWIALGPVLRHHGQLALVPQSHLLQGYEERRGADGLLPRAWSTESAGLWSGSAVWRSSDMQAGDILLFNVKTVHAATNNTSDEFRISLDTRVTFAERRQPPPPPPRNKDVPHKRKQEKDKEKGRGRKRSTPGDGHGHPAVPRQTGGGAEDKAQAKRRVQPNKRARRAA